MSSSSRDPPKLNVDIPNAKDIPDMNTEWSNVTLPVEVLLVTVEKPEFLACYKFLNCQYHSNHADLGRVYFGEMGDDKKKVALLQCSEGAAGTSAALIITTTAITILRPKVVFCVGYCGGLSKEKTKLGDVVISSKITNYDYKKITAAGEEKRGPSAAPVSPHVARLIKAADQGWIPPLEDQTTNRNIEVHYDAELLSGPEMVNFDQRIKELCEQYPRALGIEMEGQGIFVAAHDLGVEWAVIKGISDYADGSHEDTKPWRPFASVMAASLVAKILKGRGVLRDWKHYGVKQPGNNKSMIVLIGLITLLVLLSAIAWSNWHPTRKESVENGFKPVNKVKLEERVTTLLQSVPEKCPGQVDFEGNIIVCSADGRFHSIKEPWVYDGTAKDLKSGIKAEATHYKKSRHAMQAAVNKVIEQLKAQGIIKD